MSRAIGRSVSAHVPARQCAWCRDFKTDADATAYALGARVTHTICDECMTKHFAEIAGEERLEEFARRHGNGTT